MNDWDNIYAQGSAIASTIMRTNYDTVTVSNSSYSANTHAIQGKMFSIIQEIDLDTWKEADPEDIKMAMVAKIAGELIKSKMIEFTREEDPSSFKMKIRARLFVAPDDQVRLLRKAGY